MTRARVVIAGLGDSGLLTAIGLAPHLEVVGVSTKPGLLSGQELGLRLTRPERWADDYWVSFDRYRRLDGVRTLHGEAIGLDRHARLLRVRTAEGTVLVERYDVLVLAPGVSNGFWRTPVLQDADAVAAGLAAAHDRFAGADRIVVIGGGAAAVSSAANLALRWPTKSVSLHHPGPRALREHHPRVWRHVRRRLERRGVRLHPGHRAELPVGLDGSQITRGPVRWRTGQAPTEADAVLWAIGRVRPNTAWLPADLLDEDGFVRATPTLQSPLDPSIFTIGDAAATDPLRCSARNRADRLLTRNIRAHLRGGRLDTFTPRRSRWGSVLGPQPDGLQVFAPSGHPFRFPAWSVERVLRPWLVERGIYRGLRRS